MRLTVHVQGDRGRDRVGHVVVRGRAREDRLQVFPLEPAQDEGVLDAPLRQHRGRVVHDLVVVPPVDGGRWPTCGVEEKVEENVMNIYRYLPPLLDRTVSL